MPITRGVETRGRKAHAAAALVISGSLLFAGSAVASASPFDLSAGSSAFGSGEAPAPAATPRLASIDNFRDVAGPDGGYQGAFGQSVNRGVFYRSNALTTSDADAAVLDTLGIVAVYDQRTDGEVEAKPDRVPAGADYFRHPMLSGDIGAIRALTSPEAVYAAMEDTNRSFVTDPAIRAEFGAMFTEFAAADGPQLFHCTAGKDRAGWTAAMLLSLAGVDRETIYADYLLTNEYSREHREATLASYPVEIATIFRPANMAERDYLKAGFDQLEADYGNVYNYFRTGLGLSHQTITALVGKLIG